MFAPRGWLSRRFHRQVYRVLRHSELFDPSYYRAHNLPGASRLQDPLWHFVTTGWKKGLSPSTRFDSKYYMMKNDDVRVAQLNPLFHYLEYGQAERRLALRSSLEAQHVATPEASPLRYFITPSLEQQRVSVLIDSATDLTTRENLASIMSLASARAEQSSASLRILSRAGTLDRVSLEEALGTLNAGLQDSLEITEIPTTLTYSDIPFFDDEVSIATSWSSALALRFATAKKNSFSIKSPTGSTLISNDETLRKVLLQQQASTPHELPAHFVTALQNSGPTPQRGIVAFVDIDCYPIAYSLLVEAFGEFFLSHDTVSPLPSLTLVGNPGPRFAFAEELHPRLIPGAEFSPADVVGNCIVVMSSADDQTPIALANTGFLVVHATPEDSDRKGPDFAGKGAIIRTTLTPQSLQQALTEVFS